MTAEEKWTQIDNIIRLFASIDPRDNSIWGYDTNIGDINLMRELVQKEIDQISQSARENERRVLAIFIKNMIVGKKQISNSKSRYLLYLEDEVAKFVELLEDGQTPESREQSVGEKK